MEDLTTVWRPRAHIRATAVAVIWREDRILTTAVTRDDGEITGWRPPGGGIEFGERAAEAVLRELNEELHAKARVVRFLGMIENLFQHHGSPGHEIVFAFEAQLDTPGISGPERFVVVDGGYRDLAQWHRAAEFREGTRRLWPEGLLELL
ncbi:MAG: NUDIX domain-containing protein [Pseudomonadota bacterium]